MHLQCSPLPLLTHITLRDVQQGFASATFSSEDLTQAYLKRIEEVNDQVHAIIRVNENALDMARALDMERKQRGPRGPWHGVPVLIKDNTATTDMGNTCGSFALDGAIMDHDATIVEKLREAGALILGKTNMSQWGNFRSADHNDNFKSSSSNGWSATGGQTYGIYHAEQDPSGSSSGSAVATSLGLAFAALSSESDGSTICPAGRSAVVGIKPTPGLVSRHRALLSKRISTPGTMGRTVEDAASLLSVIAGECPHDPLTASIPFRQIPDYASFCDKTALKGARIGIPRNAFKNTDGNSVDQIESAALDRAIAIMTEAGAEVVDHANYRDHDAFFNESPPLKAIYGNADFKATFETFTQGLAKNPQGMHTIADLIHFTETDHREEYPSRNIDDFLGARDAPRPDDPEVKQAYEIVYKWAWDGGIRGVMEDHRLDALILPSSVSTTVPAVARCPIINVPWGFYPPGTEQIRNGRGNLLVRDANTPFGLSFFGLPYTETKLIAYAYAFEQLTQAREQGKQYITPKTELRDVLLQTS